MPAFAYQGIYIGMPMKFHQSGPTPIGNQDGFHHVELVTSRDLEHWTPVADRAVFIPNAPVGPGVYDTGTIVPPTRPIVRDGELWFYYSGIKRRFQPENVKSDRTANRTTFRCPTEARSTWPGCGSTALCRLMPARSRAA